MGGRERYGYRITERLVTLKKAGELPWTSGHGVSGLPRNGATARPYSGINVLILWVRIPAHADHRFRRMPITDSGACRSPIPVHADHLGNGPLGG